MDDPFVCGPLDDSSRPNRKNDLGPHTHTPLDWPPRAAGRDLNFRIPNIKLRNKAVCSSKADRAAARSCRKCLSLDGFGGNGERDSGRHRD